MHDGFWLGDNLEQTDMDLIQRVSAVLEYDINKARSFTVALLTSVNDHQAADKVNTALLGAE